MRRHDVNDNRRRQCKMICREVEMILFIGVLCMFNVKLTVSQMLTICTNPDPGSSCRLTCSTPDVTLPIFFLKLPETGSQEGGCTSTGTCASSNGRYTVTQNAAQSETYLDISGLTYADDDSQWVCDYGSTRSPAQTLIVPSVPAVVQFSPDPPTADLPQTLVMEAYCVYPVASLTPKLVYQDGQTNHTLDMMYPVTEINGTNGCGAHEYTVTASFQLTPTTLSGISVRFWVQVTIAGQTIGSSLTTLTFHFPEPDCNCDAVLALGIIGILISVVWMIFTGIVHFQVLKLKTDLSLLAAVLITVICVIALILCIAGIVVCEVCKTKDAETTGLILAAVGFVCSLIPIIMILLNRFGVLTRSSSNPATERDGPDGQEGKHSAAESKPRTEVSPRSAGDGSNDTPRGGKLGNVPAGRKLPMLTATALDVDGAQKANSLAPVNTTETKKLKKKKKRKSKEEKQVMSENTDNDQKEQNEQSETHDVTLPNSVCTTMEESGENATAVAKHVEEGQVQAVEGVHSQQATNSQTEVSKKEEESVVNATVLAKHVDEGQVQAVEGFHFQQTTNSQTEVSKREEEC